MKIRTKHKYLFNKFAQEIIKGGLADGQKTEPNQSTLNDAVKVEMEHTNDPEVAKEIARDHLKEDKKYYKKLETIENPPKLDSDQKSIVNLLQKNPTPTDDEIHNLAESKGIDESKLEEKAYSLLAKYTNTFNNKAEEKKALNLSFKKGFEKKATVASLLSMLGILAMPSVNKRIVQNTFELSKKRALGIPSVKEEKGLAGYIGKQVEKDIDFVEKLPKGFRKSLNEFLMKEGPSAVLYSPALAGRSLGRSLKGTADQVPFVRQFLSDVTSIDGKKATKAMAKVTKKLQQIKNPNVMTGLGFGGGALIAATLLGDSEAGPKKKIES